MQISDFVANLRHGVAARRAIERVDTAVRHLRHREFGRYLSPPAGLFVVVDDTGRARLQKNTACTP